MQTVITAMDTGRDELREKKLFIAVWGRSLTGRANYGRLAAVSKQDVFSALHATVLVAMACRAQSDGFHDCGMNLKPHPHGAIG